VPMKSAETANSFQQANELWFVQGRTKRALHYYELAAQTQPTDPVVLFQLARVLESLSLPAEARSFLASAEAHLDRLSSFGIKALRLEIAKLGRPLVYQMPIPDIAASLDIDELEKLDLSHDIWLQLAFAAREREMFALSAIAFDRSIGQIRVLELEEDERDMWREARNAWNALSAMEKDIDPTVPLPGTQPAAYEEVATSTSISPEFSLASTRRATALASEFMPIEVRIEVSPAISCVGDPLKLDVTVRNRSATEIGVNARLLLNRPDTPPTFGEIYLSVEGPPGYENTVFYNVRTGPPDTKHFALLAPNEMITKEYRLQQFESLDMPGSYRLWVTYRNTVRSSIRGVRLSVGSVSSNPIDVIRR
jgi:hypothetical protein